MTHEELYGKLCAPISHLGATDPITATDLRRFADNMATTLIGGPGSEPAPEDAPEPEEKHTDSDSESLKNDEKEMESELFGKE